MTATTTSDSSSLGSEKRADSWYVWFCLIHVSGLNVRDDELASDAQRRHNLNHSLLITLSQKITR